MAGKEKESRFAKLMSAAMSLFKRDEGSITGLDAPFADGSKDAVQRQGPLARIVSLAQTGGIAVVSFASAVGRAVKEGVKNIVSPQMKITLDEPRLSGKEFMERLDQTSEPETKRNASDKRNAFIPFRMDYPTKEKKAGELTNEQQAVQILASVRQLKNEGYEKVGITYSANREQADKIRGAYNEGKWKVGIKGSNQAEVMAIVEKKLSEKSNRDLQSVFQVLPLTTMDKGKPDSGNGLDPKCFEEDKKFIDNFIKDKSSVVLGWQNQDSNDKSMGSKFAVGGGRTEQTTHNKMSAAQSNTIQAYLQTLRETHGPDVSKRVKPEGIVKETQGPDVSKRVKPEGIDKQLERILDQPTNKVSAPLVNSKGMVAPPLPPKPGRSG